MRNSILIFSLALAGCGHNSAVMTPETQVRTEVIDRYIPVKEPCDATVNKPKDAISREANGLEDKVDRQIESDASRRKYISDLEQGFVDCGGTIEEDQ